MADRKITDLTALAAGSQATGDLVTVVDVSEAAAADKNKKMTMENLFKGIPGSVGIGTSSPSTLLHLSSTGEPKLRIQDADLTNRYVEISQAGGGTFFRSRADSSNGNFVFSGLGGGTEDEFLRIDSSGQVGIGTTSPSSYGGAVKLATVSASNTALSIASGTSSDGTLFFADGTSGTATYRGSIKYAHSGDSMQFSTAASERMRITSNGTTLIGATTSVDVASVSHANLQVKNSANLSAAFYSIANAAGPAAILALGHARGSATGVLQSGDVMGEVRFAGGDGTDLETVGASIKGEADGTPGSNDMPGRLVFFTTADGASSPTERLRIDNSGRVGIGTTSPNFLLDVNGNVGISEGQVLAWHDGSGNKAGDIYMDSSDNIVFRNTSSVNERMRITSSGKLLVGHNSATDVANIQSQLQVVGADAATGSVSIRRDQNVASGPLLVFGKSRSGSRGGNTAVQAGDTIGAVLFNGADGTDVATAAARIKAEVDNTPGSNDMPGRLVFETTADGANTLTERVRITSSGDGELLLGTTSGSNSSNTGVKLRGGSASTVDVVINAASNINLNHVYNINATNNGYRFYIQANGGIVNHSGNNTNLSDEREKKNIADMDSAWGDLKQWVLREFHFNDEDDSDPKHYGVIAQQVETVNPEVISDFQKDETTTRKGVKEMQMMWMAIKALQEAQARIETLETKVAALEAQ